MMKTVREEKCRKYRKSDDGRNDEQCEKVTEKYESGLK